jgi:peroxiredoxin Q/BCP
LNYHLLSDEKNHIRKLFEVPSNLFGLIPGRVTYVINKNGVIIGTYNALVNSLGHIGFAIDCLKKES